MSDLKPRKDLLSILKSKNDKLLRDYTYFDRTDTVSIASIQSSIFDLDSSLTSYNMENIKMDQNNLIKEKVVHPYKVRPFKFKDKVPENWLYTNPKQRALENKIPENPIDWMRTVFDENEIIPPSCKSNLKQALSKSQANLITNDNLDFSNDVSQLFSYKSVSDLKDAEISNNFQNNSEIEDTEYKITESKTAPGSIENITEFRSSFQDFVALAKLQEEKLKAEVLKRRSEFNNSRYSYSARQSPSVRYIKNSRKSVPVNRFGFPDFSPPANQPRVTTRYSKPNLNVNKSQVTPVKPRLSLHPTDVSQNISNKLQVNNFGQSADYKSRVKLYHV